MANDWDLYAIVRSCSAGVSAGKLRKRERNDDEEESWVKFESGKQGKEVGDDPFDELQHVYKPFYGKARPEVAGSAIGGSGNKRRRIAYQAQRDPLELRQQQQRPVDGENNGLVSRRRIPSQVAGRRRRNRASLVVRINASTLSRDSWSWRKYGQKPIKGSPHPRNYYRCSTSKACAARKQVELSQDNPDEYIVSYIGDHTHARPSTRRSAAGPTRNPPPLCSASVISFTDFSPTTPLVTHYNSKIQKSQKENGNRNSNPNFEVEEQEEEEEEEEDDEEEEEDGDHILIPNMQISEEIFMAMHGLNPKVSPPTAAEPPSPAKNSVNPAPTSN